MNFKIISSLLWILLNSIVAYELDSNIDVKRHLEIFKNYRHPLNPHDSSRAAAREYIQRKFHEFGLRVHNQEFLTEIASYDNDIAKVKGVNVIGESAMMSKDPKNPVILIGANYDSSLQRNPLMENGAAMAALLEISEVFQDEREKFLQICTVLFVAFDVNSKAYVPNGNGKSGSNYFVEDYLPEYLAGRKFLGAIILDSISNVNENNNSQVFFEGFDEIFPKIRATAKLTGDKGDFLSLITRGDEANTAMARLFAEKQTFEETSQFHLQEMIIRDGMKLTTKFYKEITKHSQAAFWKAQPSLPALLLTDMDISRAPPDGDLCRTLCDVEKFFSEPRKTFIEEIAKTVVRILISLQSHEEDQPETTTSDVTTKTTSDVTTTETPSCVSAICDNFLAVKIAIFFLIYLNY